MAQKRKVRKSGRPSQTRLHSPAPDLRASFEAVSRQMLADFSRTKGAGHRAGRGALREEVLRAFLTKHLPARFGVGAGQIVHPSNLMSKQCDVVIYDRLNTPLLMPDETHSLFPVESVLAIIEVKSRLSASDVDDAFANLQSAFRVTNDPSPYGPSGRWLGARAVGPACFVFGYSCDRGLDRVAEQMRTRWPSSAGRVEQPPPLVVALGKGLVGPPRWLMQNSTLEDLVRVRRTSELTLLGFFIHLLGDITTPVIT